MLKSGITILLTWAVTVTANTCTYYDIWDNYEGFSCPRTFDSSNEYYCCGSGSSQYCCDYDDYYNTGYINIPGIIGGVISFLIFVGIIVAFSICCCVASCPLYQRRYNRRVVAGGRGGIVVSQTQHTSRMHPPPHPGMAYPMQAQYGMGTTFTRHHGNIQPAPYGYGPQPGNTGFGVPIPQQQGIHPPPVPPPNYNQAVTSQSQTVTVSTEGTANPVYPPV